MAGINEIEESISRTFPGQLTTDIVNNIKGTMKAIKQICESGERVIIKGFGTFQIKQRKARIGRNPQTGEPFEIPAKKVLTFKAVK